MPNAWINFAFPVRSAALVRSAQVLRAWDAPNRSLSYRVRQRSSTKLMRTLDLGACSHRFWFGTVCRSRASTVIKTNSRLPNRNVRGPRLSCCGYMDTSSCPSWDRTRTLLIQSQACCQLHQGAVFSDFSAAGTRRNPLIIVHIAHPFNPARDSPIRAQVPAIASQP